MLVTISIDILNFCIHVASVTLRHVCLRETKKPTRCHRGQATTATRLPSNVKQLAPVSVREPSLLVLPEPCRYPVFNPPPGSILIVIFVSWEWNVDRRGSVHVFFLVFFRAISQTGNSCCRLLDRSRKLTSWLTDLWHSVALWRFLGSYSSVFTFCTVVLCRLRALVVYCTKPFKAK